MTKYFVRSDLITAKLEGYVEANSEEEAIEKWEEGETLGQIDEYPERAEINIEVEEVDELKSIVKEKIEKIKKK